MSVLPKYLKIENDLNNIWLSDENIKKDELKLKCTFVLM